MARLNYTAYADELEIMAGAFETKAHQLEDVGELHHAAFYFGCAAAIDQLFRLGKPEDAPYRVIDAWAAIEGRMTDGE